jgi:hypothetical protein
MGTSLLDEISKVVDDDLPAEGEEMEVVEEPETPAEPEPEAAPEPEETPAEPEAEEPAEEPTEEPEAEEPTEDEGEPTEEDGEEPVAEEKPKEGEEKPAEGKAEDPVNDPIPEGLAERTKQRIETLVTRVREGEQYRSQYEELVGTLTSTGASPEEYGQMVQYMRLVHSDDPQDLEVAMQALQAELRGVAMKLGKPVPGVDFLADYPDLQTAVEAQEITAEHAQEIAVNRSRQAAATQQSQTRSQQQAQQQEYQTAVRAAQTQLNQLEAQLKSDPQYQAKYDILVPALRETFQSIHPSQWTATFKRAYDNLTLPATPAPAPPPKKPAQQPLRPRQPAGQGERQPSSVLDAVTAALDNL